MKTEEALVEMAVTIKSQIDLVSVLIETISDLVLRTGDQDMIASWEARLAIINAERRGEL